MSTMSRDDERRAAINRLMIAKKITEEEAQRQLREAFARRYGTTPPSQLDKRGLSWLAEHRAEQEQQETDRLMRQTPRSPRPDPTPRRVPLDFVEGLEIRVTVTEARMLDLLALGATPAEIARIETVAPSTVWNTLARLYARLEACDVRSARTAWAGICTRAGRPLPESSAKQLRLVRGEHLAPSGELVLTDEQWHLIALLDQDLTTAQIALALQISVFTVKRRLQTLYGAMGVRTRAGALARFYLDRESKEAAHGHERPS